MSEISIGVGLSDGTEFNFNPKHIPTSVMRVDDAAYALQTFDEGVTSIRASLVEYMERNRPSVRDPEAPSHRGGWLGNGKADRERGRDRRR